MRNLAELVCDRVRRRPAARFGMAGDATPTLAEAVGLAMGAVGALEHAGAGNGRRVALIGATSNSYVMAWLALVLAGAEAALVNPDYPDELLAEMLEQLSPDAVVWVGRAAGPSVAPDAAHLDATGLDRGRLTSAADGQVLTAGPPLGQASAAETPADRALRAAETPADRALRAAETPADRALRAAETPADRALRAAETPADRALRAAETPADRALRAAAAGLSHAPGLARGRFDVAGYMHTSGTTGVPKFCEQTHEYFLRLGRFIADSMCLSEADTVLAPLPMFHINPLGYGVVGGLTGGADVLGLERFSARRFWPLVRDAGVTALILHAPPVEILKRATTGADAAGHRVSRMFFADPDFLETFSIPLGFSAYGSTEAGGLSHIWAWRRGERPDLAEGMSRYGGRSRHEVQWRVNGAGQSESGPNAGAGSGESDTDGPNAGAGPDAGDAGGNSGAGEIAVRADRPGVLFSGYRRADGLVRPFDDDGWFATGDLGRVDAAGNLVFIERRSESIRVKGEFVPIGYVEQRFASVEGLDDVAVWHRSSELVDDEIVLYVEAGGPIPTDAILAVSAGLPTFMRPAMAARVAEIPRDSGVGKVRRRLLNHATVLEAVDLEAMPPNAAARPGPGAGEPRTAAEPIAAGPGADGP